MHALGVEFGELSRLFIWGKNPERKQVGEEMADMLIYLEYLADGFNLGMDKEVAKKIEFNGVKYPIGQDNESLFGWNLY